MSDPKALTKDEMEAIAKHDADWSAFAPLRWQSLDRVKDAFEDRRRLLDHLRATEPGFGKELTVTDTQQGLGLPA